MIQRIILQFCGYVGCDDATNVSNFGYEPIKFSSFMLNIRMHTMQILGLWLRLECSLDSLSIDSAHVIYVSEGYDVAYNRRTASQPSHVVLRVTWYVKTFQKRKLRVLNPARINVFYWFNWLNLIGS